MKKCQLSLKAAHWVFADLALTRTCEVSYDSADPLAVTMVFGTDGERPVRWVLSRDLLADGLTGSVGEGDVRLWPVHDHDGGLTSLCVRLGNLHTALIEFDAEPVANWLSRTYELVPRGTELDGVDWDELVQPVE
ncbi:MULTISPECIES: SsgA family sporulation/cell division regulator [unclassified Streptomyces]|uniref:SsgA family sporulation/cell division regulator n=1 Tax=unclassified Streptomyces TaxID=2593676 RepID=UPI000DB8FA42|nr:MULTISPECIES: SsgA family sporulation/cell division regulator [unclassified Streptomyces]MYT71733.1 SsgA family sporulation/cell division regulator [Streptomyces sp. SID8367]RAJ72566.1 sporulation and cell division protein SsgA [Streptomyces sp. PsTaAH-137]